MVLLKVGLVVTGGHVCRQVLLLHDLLGAVISLPCVVRWLHILAVRFHLVDARLCLVLVVVGSLVCLMVGGLGDRLLLWLFGLLILLLFLAHPQRGLVRVTLVLLVLIWVVKVSTSLPRKCADELLRLLGIVLLLAIGLPERLWSKRLLLVLHLVKLRAEVLSLLE